VLWIWNDIAAGDADGRVAEGADWKIADVVADGFGVGDDGRGNLQKQLADAFGIYFDGGDVQAAVGERVCEGFRAEKMQPGVAFADEERERLIDAFHAGQAAEFADTRLHFGEDDFLLIDDWVFELGIGSFEAMTEVRVVEGIEQKENSGRTRDVLRAG